MEQYGIMHAITEISKWCCTLAQYLPKFNHNAWFKKQLEEKFIIMIKNWRNF